MAPEYMVRTTARDVQITKLIMTLYLLPTRDAHCITAYNIVLYNRRRHASGKLQRDYHLIKQSDSKRTVII